MTMNAVVPFTDMEKMATTLAKQGIFGTDDPQTLLSLMLVAQAEGLHPASVAVDYDFIQKKPAKKPAAMLRDFTKNGGRVDWHKLTDAEADATFSHPSGGTVRIRWDMKKAAQAGLASKEMWRKYPSAMLRSRCVSEGMRAVFPAATGGLYTPEEVGDMEPINMEPINMEPIKETRPTDIPGESRELTDDDLLRRDLVADDFRAALNLDMQEEDKAREILVVWERHTKDQEYFKNVLWPKLESSERRAIKAYVKMARESQSTVLVNGRSAM